MSGNQTRFVLYLVASGPGIETEKCRHLFSSIMTINKTTKALQLIRELQSDPVDFENRGRGNELLQFYGEGISLDSLLPLLSHHHVSVRGTAMFVAAEPSEVGISYREHHQ
ncbi:MAG: hypothetical protein V4719_13105 [Planctomycetota bacterium]